MLTATQRCAWPVVARMGVILGPSLWFSVGLLTCCAWCVVFGDLPREPRFGLGVAAVLLGLGGVAATWRLVDTAGKDDAVERDDENDASEALLEPRYEALPPPGRPPPPPARPRRSGLLDGVPTVRAAAAGLLFGSLLAPFRAAEAAGANATEYRLCRKHQE